MPTYKYQPYYQYNGPTHSEPMREELSTEEAKQRLDLFIDEIGAYFENVGVQIETTIGGVVCVSTDLMQKDCDDRVKRCLNNLDLYAKKIPG